MTAPVPERRAGIRLRVSDEARRARMAHRHRLLSDRHTDDVALIADDLVALHSSDPASVYLSVFVRMREPDPEAVDAALYDERSLVRHHAMRRTIWVMTRETVRLAHGAATAKIASVERKRTARALADSTDIADPEAWLAAAKTEVAEHLTKVGTADTRTIGRQLPHLVIPVKFGGGTRNPATLNAHTKVLQGAGFDATLVRGRPNGGWVSSEYEWASTEAWLGEPIAGLDELDAATELIGRHLRAFGPVTETDLRWWFGWTAGLTRKALARADAESVVLDDGADAWVSAGDGEASGVVEPWVRLLPGLDPTAMGWKLRDWYLDPSMAPYLFDRFGNAGPTIWADGRIVGGWVQRPDGTIGTDVLAPISPVHRRLLDEAIEELHAAVGDVVVRPRFPAPCQKALLAG